MTINKRIWNYFLPVLLALSTGTCKTYINYSPTDRITDINDTSAMSVFAHVWVGAEGEHMSIGVKFNHPDSLFVKDISVYPVVTNESFPVLQGYSMHSYYYWEKDDHLKGNMYWKEFESPYFSGLPVVNRQTNMDNNYIGYTVRFLSKEKIKLYDLTFNVEAVLINKEGKEIWVRDQFSFKGKRGYGFGRYYTDSKNNMVQTLQCN